MSARPERAWEVFAREDAGHADAPHRTVEASTRDDAEVFARTLYDEWRWVEMFIVPRRAITRS